MKWETVIGLEVHTQLTTRSKIFSGASIAFGAEANTQASAVDIALPGVLPVLNRGAVERAIRFGPSVPISTVSTSLRGRIISTRTCPRAIRSVSSKSPSSREAA